MQGKNIVIVDSNNRMICDIQIGHDQVLCKENLVEVDEFEDDVRIRIKQDIVGGENSIKVMFREDDDKDCTIPYFRSDDGK